MDLYYADEFDTISAAFPWIFAAAVAIILGGWIIGAVVLVRNRRVLRQAGIDPTTAKSQLAIRMMRSQALAEPTVSASSRLAELGGLRDRGLITAEEYDARRSQIIADI